MFDELLRRFKDRLLAPLARLLGARVSPNALSFLAFAFGVSAAGAAWQGHDVPALVLWLFNRSVDGLDGTQSRVHGLQSDFGGYLDIMLDFTVYALIPVALVLAEPRLALAGMVLLATFFVNGASWMYLAAILERRRAGAPSRGDLTTITMPPGIIAGTETIVFYSAMLLWPDVRALLFWTMAALVTMNVGQRLWWARRHL